MADRVGKLDRKITIQQATETRDSYGAWTTSWTTYASRFAAIRYTKGSEPYSSERKTGLYTVLFTVRWDSLTKAVTPKMRISYDSRIYDIRQVTERTDEFRKMYVTIEGEYKDLA